jgi:hypothetical protein
MAHLDSTKIYGNLNVTSGATISGTASKSVLFTEDFESGSFDPLFTFGGDANWTIAVGGGNGGGNAAVSGVIGFSASTSMILTITTEEEVSTLNCDYAQSAEECCDFLEIFINGIAVFTARNANTAFIAVPELKLLGKKEHIIEWKYHTDSNTASGTDNTHVDNIVIESVPAEVFINTPIVFNEEAVFKNNFVADKGMTSEDRIYTVGLSSTASVTAPYAVFSSPTESAILRSNAAFKVFGINDKVTVFSGYSQVTTAAAPTVQKSVQFNVVYTTETGGLTTLAAPDPYAYLTLSQGSTNHIWLVAGHSSYAASQINSRLQVGYSASIPNLTDLHALSVNGDGYFTGDVGIGTSPNAKLDIKAASGVVGLNIEGLDAKAFEVHYSGEANAVFSIAYGGVTKIKPQSGAAGGTAALEVQENNLDNAIWCNGRLKVSGNATISGNSTAVDHLSTSDIRLKENIRDYKSKKIDVRWREYELKEDGSTQLGVIADELLETNPEFVIVPEKDEDMKSVRYTRLLIAKIAELEARLEKAGL